MNTHTPDMRFLVVAILIIWCSAGVAAGQLAERLAELDYVMERRNTYYMAHEHMIDSLKEAEAAVSPGDLRGRFAAIHQLFNAYRSYQNDSSRVMVNRELALARRIGDADLTAVAKYDDLFTYMSRGDFTNAADVLRGTDLSGVSDSLKVEFYILAARLYSDLSNFTGEKFGGQYGRRAMAYGDTVLRLAPPGSYAYIFATYFLHGYKQDRDRRINTLSSLLDRDDVAPAVKAMFYSMLGDIYLSDNQDDLGLEMKARSAVLDIKSATRETTSKHFLAYEMFKRGDVNRAARYIHAALEDAQYYNAPQRKAEIGQSLSLIEASRYSAVKDERNLLWVFFIVALAFAGVVGGLFLYIRRQNRRLKESQAIIGNKNAEISKQNDEIRKANDTLRSLNYRLRESIKIKDEYLGYVFYLNSEYISKLEKIYKLVNLKIVVRQAADLQRLLPVSDIKVEKEKLLKEFDRIFLTLFPTFIEQYQALFAPDDQCGTEGADGILTPEMRIFALIRLGITSSANIARFLNYSINTINTYKTKAKNRSIVDNEEFEARIMQIRSVKS